MGDGTSLVSLGELTKPATVLVEKISDLVGGVFKPYQIVRVARAEAEADRIRVENQIQISEIQRRAFLRFLHEEGFKQENMEEITRKVFLNSRPKQHLSASRTTGSRTFSTSAG